MSQLIDIHDISNLRLLGFFITLKEHGLLGELNVKNLHPQDCVDMLTNIKPRLRGVVLLEHGAIVGIYIGVLGNNWYDVKNICFNEMMLFILPSHRGCGNYIKMSVAVEQMCKKSGVKTIQVGNAVRENTAGYTKLMEKNGFTTYPVYRKTIE